MATVFDLLRKELDEDMAAVKDSLATGGAANFEAYNRMVGRYQALQMLHARVVELEARFIDD